jgi:pimeloyl-ACP methyl ester carboxylesterase
VLNWLLLGRFSSQTLRSALARALALVSSRALRARVASVFRVNVVAKLSTVKVPVLYLRASEDRIIPSSASALIARNLPAVGVVEIEGPHFLLQAAPAIAARHVKEFVHGLRTGP